MKKLMMGIVAALIATPAMAFEYVSTPLAPSALEQYLIDEFDELTISNGITARWVSEVDGITIQLAGPLTAAGAGNAVNLSCLTTTTQMAALTAADHARFLKQVAAQDWWFDQADATDSHNYWEDRAEATLGASTSAAAGIVSFMSTGKADQLSRACYSEWIGNNGTGIKEYITLPGLNASYNQHVVGLIAAGEAD